MDYVSETFDLFDKHVPSGHQALIVLKVHLLVEMRLHQFIEARINDPSLVKAIHDEHTFRSGKGLTLLARALASYDDIPADRKLIPWDAIDTLNSLRNDLAHTLEINAQSIAEKMKNFIRQMGESITKEEDVEEVFLDCAKSLVFALANYRNPISLSDFD